MLPVEPYDEEEIESADTIIRRINPNYHVVNDENLGCRRVSTKAFSPSSGENGGMSVDVESLIIKGGQNPEEYVTTPIFTGSVKFIADDIRKLGLIVGYDPIPDNPYHGEIWGAERPNRFTKSQKRGLMRASEWYVKLEDVEIGD